MGGGWKNAGHGLQGLLTGLGCSQEVEAGGALALAFCQQSLVPLWAPEPSV